ncbi:MAG: hypothetical protein HY903_04575 [Deltaproteobacteria bacterium]|nr:hypothetical protein [Deltaproteobacteria bacterium]
MTRDAARRWQVGVVVSVLGPALLCSCGVEGDVDIDDLGAEVSEDPTTLAPDPASNTPLIYNYSGASDARVRELVSEASAGLGFSSSEGPNASDRFFVGKRYMAWIDETGFYGKMNGLWRLNGAAGDALDIVVRDDGRPVNFFVPGEDGDGRWPAGYPGAEHIEFPNRTPEPNDKQDCAQGDWCNQFGLNEAGQFTDGDIPWWRACNNGSPSFQDRFLPVEERAISGGLRLVYEGPLVKEADGDGRWDGDECHADYLFADGVRRRVYLRVGLELFANADHVDRVMQVRNPAGNPAFDGPMSFIGGFVITAWPSPHPLKTIDQFIRPEVRDIPDRDHGVTLYGGRFNAHNYAETSGDEVMAWLGQPITLSTTAGYVAGKTVTLSHVGGSDNDDVGICFCKVHGGLEMGGGLLHGGISLPVAAGRSSAEARRRLTLSGDVAATPPTPPPPTTPPPAPPPTTTPPTTFTGSKTYQAERDLPHGMGRADADGWSAATALDAAGYLSYGPYATDWGAGTVGASFYLLLDNNSADNSNVVTLDVFDATAGVVLATRTVARRQWAQAFSYQAFAVNADLAGRAGHRLEARVYWRDMSYVRLDKIVVTAGGASDSTPPTTTPPTTPPPTNPPPTTTLNKTYQAERDLAHGIGRVDADGWSAATGLDGAGHLSFGPYATDWGSGTVDATFYLMVDNNSADNLNVLTLDLYDATSDQVLASRTPRRQEWTGTFAYQGFTLSADLAGRAGHRMEARIYWRDVSYVRFDRLQVQGR